MKITKSGLVIVAIVIVVTFFVGYVVFSTYSEQMNHDNVVGEWNVESAETRQRTIVCQCIIICVVWVVVGVLLWFFPLAKKKRRRKR